MIVSMLAEVTRESLDPLGHDGDLNFRRAGVTVMRLAVFDDFLFLIVLQRHVWGASSKVLTCVSMIDKVCEHAKARLWRWR
jgi:hypothetical protein